MRVHITKTEAMAVLGFLFLLFIINFEQVESKKSPVVSITADNLPRSMITPSKAKRSDESSYLVSDADTNMNNEIPDHYQHHHHVESHEHETSSQNSSGEQVEEDSRKNPNSTTTSSPMAPEKDMEKSSKVVSPPDSHNNNNKKDSSSSGGSDLDVIIGCVIMAVIIVVGLGIGLGLNIYGKRQDTSRDAADFGIMDDLIEIRENPNPTY